MITRSYLTWIITIMFDRTFFRFAFFSKTIRSSYKQHRWNLVNQTEKLVTKSTFVTWLKIMEIYWFFVYGMICFRGVSVKIILG